MSLPYQCNVSGGPAGIETSPRRRRTPNQPPNLLTTSLGNARNAGIGLGLGGVVQTPVSSTTLSSPFSAYPQSPSGAMRGASPMDSRSAYGFSGQYNPQQWGAMNNTSPNSISMAGEHRQTSQSSRTAHLAPRPVGPDEPVASPPPPYSPRRDQQSQASPRTSDITSPADTTSPCTDSSRYGTPVSAATTLSPDLVSRFPGGRSPLLRQYPSPNGSPNAASAPFVSTPSFPPPPGTAQRIRAGSNLLSSLALRGKSSKVQLAVQTLDAKQDHTAQILAQASSANYNDPKLHPPAARRAASTGGIGLAGPSSRSISHSRSPATWEPNMHKSPNVASTPSFPPPPPRPPPHASARSQSLNRPMGSESSGLAPAPPIRSRYLTQKGTSLDTVPPTPAGWIEEDCTHDGASLRSHGPSSLHIDTGSISRMSDPPMTAASTRSRRDSGGLFRSPAVRSRSAIGIRERRSESRNGKARAVEDSPIELSSNVAPWAVGFGDVRPTNLVLSTSQKNASKSNKSSTPKSGKSMRNLDGALSSPEAQKSSGKAMSYTTPQPGSSRSQLFSANLSSTPHDSPCEETLARPSSSIVSPPLPPKISSVPTSKRVNDLSKSLSLIVPPGPERPISHLLHSANPGDSLQIPLSPSTKAAPESPEDLLGPESPKLFAGRAIERHRMFADREAAATSDSERLEIFVQYMKAESRIRRERYASVFEENGLVVDELTQGLFGEMLHDRRRHESSQETSKRTSSASSESDSSAVSRKHETPSSASTNSQQRPESTYWKEDYVPVLSPIAASMSIVTGQDETDSRGRLPSRWFENESYSGEGSLGDAFNVFNRTRQEKKYMGTPREARNPPASYVNIASAATGQQPGASGQYGPDQYPPEKTGLHEEVPPPPFLPPTPLSAPFTPDSRRVDFSRLITLPPPFPRRHPAVNNNHPALIDFRSVIRSLQEKEEIETITESYRRQRSQFREDIEHGSISQEGLDAAEVEFEEKIANSEKEVAQSDQSDFQHIVLTPLHTLFSDRLKLADATLEKLSSRLFFDAQSQNPNLPQEEGDDEPELLEKLTLLKWLFEAKETLHRQIYDLLTERNKKYEAVVLLPYKQSQNQEKQAEAELFFARDAQERKRKQEQAVCHRAQAFKSVIEETVMRGVEAQLSAFWDIGPSLLEVLHKVPSRLDSFDVLIPDDEYAENTSYYDHPLQYLYSLLCHAEKSAYQFIESQINLLCILHEIRSHALAAVCRVEAQRDGGWAAAEEEQRKEELTVDLKEKVGVVEGQWEEALGREMLEVRERVREALLEEGGWDDEGNEI